jgi:hypothetical protein
MAEKKPSLDWLDDLAAVSAQQEKTPSATHGGIAKALKLNRPYVSNLLALKPIFDPPTVAKVRQEASEFILSYRSAQLLTGLNGKVEDFSKSGREAVEKILADHLGTAQIKDLVAKTIGKKTPEQDSANAQAFFEQAGQRIGGFIGKLLDILLFLRPSGGSGHISQAEGEGNQPAPTAKHHQAGHSHVAKTLGHYIGWAIKEIWSRFWGLMKLVFSPFRGVFVFLLRIVVILAVLWMVYDRVFHPGDLTWRFKHLLPSFSLGSNAPATAPITQVLNQTPANVKKADASDRQVKTSNSKLLISNSSVSSSNPAPIAANSGVTLAKDQAEDAGMALRFVQVLYSVGYKNYEDCQNSLLEAVAQEHEQAFKDEFFSSNKIDEMKNLKQTQTFTSLLPVQMTSSDRDSEDFLVKGTVTTRQDQDPKAPVITTKQVSTLVLIEFDTNNNPIVTNVIDVTPK